jgi:hypothetical protein
MSKNVREHEKKYWHISKCGLGILIMWIIGLFLVINNVVLIVKAYPSPVSALVVLPSILLWFGTIVGMVVITAKTI